MKQEKLERKLKEEQIQKKKLKEMEEMENQAALKEKIEKRVKD